ncbi:adhesion G protein-coupled receptor E5-like [Montipora capricornis]|uniref:adhesion G protein-coupled receptor E5-like n=1 Tax=Montipora capricornis TaxID=246305 RepID=UPI0035F1C2C8
MIICICVDLQGTNWTEQIRNFQADNFYWSEDLKKYSCSNRCGVDERNASDIPKDGSESLRCFCDKFCDEYGDCCFDFNKLCRKRVNPRGNPLSQHEICRPVVSQHSPDYAGFAVRSTCPRNWKDEIVRTKCQNEDQSDLFNDWPVFDREKRITYRNVFCARCNGAVNTTYWKLEADCSEWFNTTAFNLSDFMRFVHANCSVKIIKPWGQYLRRCIPRFQDCSGIGREKNGSYCQSQCLGYAFPVCLIRNKKTMASLLLLLATYALFSELRYLPGRIIINLSLSLLLYQGVFLSAMKTSSREQCQVIAVLLHYFVLCSFTWMNAMAYDVHKTFTSSDGGHGSSRQGNQNKRLMRYCLFGWGVPAIAVSIFVIIDQILSKGFIGYGEGEAYCFISKPEAVLYFFVAPVALIMLFNAFALVHTVLHIVKTRKRTQKVTNKRHSTGVALVFVKMASVMGVTWILGIVANVKALSFLWYPYVILNSLQGFFLFTLFVSNTFSLRGSNALLRYK